jgi:sugar lactone lactonase YvrE
MQQAYVIAAEELPDYKPPIAPGSVRADADGNLWIQTIPSQSIPGGDVYDIVSRQGELVNRIQLPPGYALVGFGKGKVVYLSMRDTSGIHLARVRLR